MEAETFAERLLDYGPTAKKKAEAILRQVGMSGRSLSRFLHAPVMHDMCRCLLINYSRKPRCHGRCMRHSSGYQAPPGAADGGAAAAAAVAATAHRWPSR